ncbi:MAG: ATP-grasp domain-containing protein [Treponema sp.]|nr:ATP-grasp domain-containing protein [Treponema sp.]
MQKKEYVLVLGASLMQKPAMEAAMELGYKTLVIDANPEAACVKFADVFFPVDLKDREAVLKLALEYRDSLCAVFTAGTDFSSTVSYAAEKLDLPCHSFESTLNATDKYLMRTCFSKNSVSSPAFEKISRNEIMQFIAGGQLDSLSFPKVVKPVDNMGARGCRLIRSRQEFLPAVEDAVRASRCATSILEDYMEGPEFSIDALVWNGSLTITGFADRHIFFEPYFVETGHTIPSSVTESEKILLIKTFAKGVEALGLTCGAAKADIKLTKDGPMIGEIAARLSGGYMSGWTYPYASGLNLTKQALLIAAGREPVELLNRRVPLVVSGTSFSVYEVPCAETSAERSWISIPGVVKNIYGLDRASFCPFIEKVFPRVKEGDSVDFPRNNISKCGNVISVCPDAKKAAWSAETAVSNIVLRLEPSDMRTRSFLARTNLPHEKNFPPDAYTVSEEDIAEAKKFVEKYPVIRADAPVRAEGSPYDFEKYRDFNYRTPRKSLELFNEISPLHPELDTGKFLDALIRGGLQGILYLSDTVSQRGSY